MYIKGRNEENRNKLNEDDSNNNITTIKMIFIINALFLFFYYQAKGISSEIDRKENISNENNAKKNHVSTKINKKANNIIDNYLNSIPDKYSLDKKHEKEVLETYFSLINISDNTTISTELKNKILDKIIDYYKKNITTINKIFITNNIAFGNTLLCLNNIIFYCEILGCKEIYLNSSVNWYIKNEIITNKTQISLISSSKINCKGSKTLCIPFLGGLCLNPIIIKQKIRLNILKNEIKNNLPKVITNPDDLYIHIRCGNIFDNELNPSYAQPPYCFYQKILKNFKFRNIYLISINDNSPVIKKLLKNYPQIITRNNSLEKDFAYLSNAYNLVGSVSSFLITAIKFNDNLHNYWEYDIYRKSEKFLHLHHDIYEFPRKFKIYKMIPSTKYKNEMFSWKKEKEQLKLMVEEKCLNSKFIILK